MTIQVFGHKSPDTDSTGSAIIWAWYLNEVKGEAATSVLLGAPNTEAAFMLQRWGFEQPAIIADVEADAPVVIVDTNNPAELPASINSADIRAIIDHHKLVGGLETKGPIDITVRPLACTATIMHDLMGTDADRMPDDIKGAALTCILSDTLEFRSPPPRRMTAPWRRSWPRIWASTSPNTPPRCLPPNPMSPRFPMRS